MDVFVGVLLTCFLTVLMSLTFGFLPGFFRSQVSAMSPKDPNYNRLDKRNVLMAFLLNFGGGVLLTNVMCHWLPETKKKLAPVESVLPLAEVSTLCGFFFILIAEEVIHHLVHPAPSSGKTDQDLKKGNGKNGDIELNGFNAHKPNLNPNTTSFLTAADCHDPVQTIQDLNHRHDGPVMDRSRSMIRTFFIVSALSFHSILEGLAMSLADEIGGVWINFAALAMHKFVVAFSVGIDLVVAKVNKAQFVMSILVFSFSPAIGTAIGLVLTTDDSYEIPVQFMQAVASGTILYIVFFEIFPKAKEIGGSGSQHIFAMVTGFVVFLPSLYVHYQNEAGKDEAAEARGGATETAGSIASPCNGTDLGRTLF